MDIGLSIKDAKWEQVYRISQGTVLIKGRKGPLYWEMRNTARTVQEKFGCYAWGDGSAIFYCGSFSKNYARSEFQTNLEGRVHNYLQTHGPKPEKETDRINTNRNVFNHINKALVETDIVLSHFRFETLQMGGDIIDFAKFSRESGSGLVTAVESFLIAYYRQQEQCHWNRTVGKKDERDKSE